MLSDGQKRFGSNLDFWVTDLFQFSIRFMYKTTKQKNVEKYIFQHVLSFQLAFTEPGVIKKKRYIMNLKFITVDT